MNRRQVRLVLAAVAVVGVGAFVVWARHRIAGLDERTQARDPIVRWEYLFTRERTPDEEFVLAAMQDSIAGGMPPAEVAELVFDAVEHDRFWVPTKPSYHDQIRARHDDMQALRHPASAQLD